MISGKNKLKYMRELFNQSKFEEFEAAYNKAVQENKTEFSFENNTILVTYAKYLIDYLSNTYE